MRDTIPTPEEARAALAEAGRRTGPVHRADSQFRYILLALAATYIGVGLVVGFGRGGGAIALVALLATFTGGLAAMIVTFRRMHAYSTTGELRFVIYCSSFLIWNLVVLEGSRLAGWSGPGQPGSHFSTISAVASIPLLVGAWLLARRRA